MDKKAITLQQLEEALRDLARWIRDKLSGYVAEPNAEGKSGYVLTTNGAGGRSWEAQKSAASIVVGGTTPEGPALWFDTGEDGTLVLDENESGYEVMAVVGEEVYGIKNATVNEGAQEGQYDFTVI